MSNNTMSIFAEALANNREFKNARINGLAVGPANATIWNNSVKALRIPAYAIRAYRYNHMGDESAASAADMNALYNVLRPVLELVGEVNGAKLDARNMAEEIISNAMRFRVIDLTEEMAHAHMMRKVSKKAFTESETTENKAEYDKWNAECKRLEELPGNCKRIAEIQAEATFIKAVETLLGDAILKQSVKSAEEVAAEEAAKKAERKARHAAQKAAKKAEAATAKTAA